MRMKKKVIALIILIMAFSFILPKNSMAFLWWDDPIYREPNIIPEDSQSSGLDDMIKDAEEFEKERGATVGGSGSQTFQLNQGKLQSFSSNLYSVLLISATAVSVLIGLIIGAKYMIGSVEEKAEYKKLLVPYLAGCVAVYGALGIWKLCVTILGNI